jgi:hypothetical protein
MTSRSRQKQPKSKYSIRNKSQTKKETNNHWEVLIRAVDGYTMGYISSLKGIYPRISNDWMPSVYTTYLSSKIHPEFLHNEWSHQNLFGNIIIVIDPIILKDLPFIICNADMAGYCKNPDISLEEREKYTLFQSKGKLKYNPDMTSVSDWINKFLDPKNEQNIRTHYTNRLNPRWTKLNKILNILLGTKEIYEKLGIQWSHEVLFDYIPIKYIRHIFTYDKRYISSIKAYLPKMNVEYIRYPHQDEIYYYRDYIVPKLKSVYSYINKHPLK